MSLTLYLQDKYELKRPITVVGIKHFMKEKEGIYADKNLILVNRETGEKLKLDPNLPIPENIRKLELIQKLNKTFKETITDGFSSDIHLFTCLIKRYEQTFPNLQLCEYLKQETGYCDFWVNEFLNYVS